VSGQPSLYPFDRYALTLAVVLQTTLADGTTRPLRGEPGDPPITLTLQSRLQRLLMLPPAAIDAAGVRTETDPDAFLYVRALEFRRPVYLMVLAVLLVTLIASAAIYSVRSQAVPQLLAGVGSLVLGVWGIRAILVPGVPPYVTAIDLALSLVILILLVGIIARGLLQYRRTATAEPRPAEQAGDQLPDRSSPPPRRKARLGRLRNSARAARPRSV
jgi:hypothetical protein